MKKLKGVLSETDGATVIEYVLIAGLIAVAVVGSIAGTGGGLNETATDTFGQFSDALEDVSP